MASSVDTRENASVAGKKGKLLLKAEWGRVRVGQFRVVRVVPPSVRLRPVLRNLRRVEGGVVVKNSCSFADDVAPTELNWFFMG